MEAVKLQLATRTLTDPAARQWQRAPVVNLTLRGTDPASQPSPYVRTVWAGKNVGAVRSLSVRAAHNQQNIFFRLEWPDPSCNMDYAAGTAFPDAAAVLLAAEPAPPLKSMGAPGQPIEAWCWRANHPEAGEALRFQGFATEEPADGPSILNKGVWDTGRWAVVISALRDASRPHVAFAVWEGGNQERAGLHSYSPQWQELEIL